ncbi:sugar phosphate isomerase/epimerase [Reichenbachiella carrageenanivorans]|uniref:Sugar phosphate isomerase/epimerase n=1 Tax=Reichenbachiella carrageenanivorans TaxID=2979869 RepID=A0ABY6D4C2_9BACT|nr:sugar phosphate isomerase/epimerase [Reichenbachiella carrageenanivorans]UXX80995.1 sugar phosphate isomerase/epimerase [Reichenbachiella carrageenanivorans]
MQTLFFCPQWGMDSGNFDTFLAKAKKAGYDGVELPFSTTDQNTNASQIAQVMDMGMEWIGQHWETDQVDFEVHKALYLERLMAMAIHNPLFINSHTGRDFFSFDQNMELIEAAAELSQQTGIKIIHETHRSRFNYAAHVTSHFLKANKDIRLTADFSHWCCVAETLLDDQAEAIDLAIARSEHIHSRVGYTQGPQVPDPRANEWNVELQTFLGWWDRIIDRARKEDLSHFTITTEFGPFPYMPIVPHTKQPLTSQWEVNVFMKNLLDQRYNQE